MNIDAKSTIIFDFDGTLVDSFLETLTILYAVQHKRPLPREDISRLRGLSKAQLLKQLQIPWWQVFFLVRRFRHAMSSQMSDIALVPDIAAAVETLSTKHQLFILSSNSVPNISACLRHNLIDQFFTVIEGGASPFDKSYRLARLLRRHKLKSASTYYICDEPEDIKAAHQAHIKAVAVSWGYSNIQVLKAQNPDFLIFNPQELLTVFR